jgi:hypothetical protein
MATALDEEKKKRTAFPTDYPPPGRVYGTSQTATKGLGVFAAPQQTPATPESPKKNTAFPSNPPTRSIYDAPRPDVGFGALADRFTMQPMAADAASMANRPLVQSATSGAIANQPPALPAATPQAAGQRIIAMPSTTSAQEAMMVQLQNSDGVVQVAKDPNAPAPWWSRNDDVEAMRAKQAAQPQFQPNQRTRTERDIPGASGELGQPGQPRGTPTPVPTPTVQSQGADNGITRIDAPGASPLFTNMAASEPSNVGLMARGPVSAQNMGAADALAARYATPQVQQQAQPVGAVTPASTGGFGLLDNNARRDRELRMEASSSRNPGEGGRAYRARLAGAANDLSSFRNTQNAAPAQAAAQNLGMRKLAMEEAVNKSRTGLDAMRMGIDERRAGEDAATSALTREAEQMGINKAKQIEALQQQWQAAGSDPAKQKAIAQQLAVLSGKGESGKWAIQVTPPTKNIDGTTTPGSVYRYNTATGEVIPVEGGAGGQQEQQPYPENTKLTGKDGKAYVVKNGVPVLEK